MVRPAYDLAELTQLPVAERLRLLDALWESLRQEPAAAEFSAEELALIDARAAEHARDPGAAVPWDVVRAELLAAQEADERRARRTGIEDSDSGERGG
jgi:putative addiction module component (TIGR02574 family)